MRRLYPALCSIETNAPDCPLGDPLTDRLQATCGIRGGIMALGETVSLASLSDRQREQAMTRFTVLQPHLERNVPLARAARDGGIALRTARRWLKRYHAEGLVGLARSARGDAGQRKLSGGFYIVD